MADVIVMMVLTNLGTSVGLHAQLICLPVKMDQNASSTKIFAMGLPMAVAVTIRTTLPPIVTAAPLTICSGVRRLVLMFVSMFTTQPLGSNATLGRSTTSL